MEALRAIRPSSDRDAALGLTTVDETEGFLVTVWRNVIILQVYGAIDQRFLDGASKAQDVALAHSPGGYCVVTIAEKSARIPGQSFLAEASRLRSETEHMLRRQSVIVGGDGFFASTMRSVLTGIMTMAQSRVPSRVVFSNTAAAQFLGDGLTDDVTTEELCHVLDEIRNTAW